MAVTSADASSSSHTNQLGLFQEALDQVDHLQWYKPSTVIIGDKNCRQMDIISVLSQLGITLDPDNLLGRSKFWLRCSAGTKADIRVRWIFEQFSCTGQPGTLGSQSHYGEPEYQPHDQPKVIELFSLPDTASLPQLPKMLRCAQLEVLTRTMRREVDGSSSLLINDISDISQDELERMEKRIFDKSPLFVPNTLVLDVVLPEASYVSVIALPPVLVSPKRHSDHYYTQEIRDLIMEDTKEQETTILLAVPQEETMSSCESLALTRSSPNRCQQVIGIRVLDGSGPASNIEASDPKSWDISGGIIQFNRQDKRDSDRAFATLANTIRKSNHSAVLQR